MRIPSHGHNRQTNEVDFQCVARETEEIDHIDSTGPQIVYSKTKKEHGSIPSGNEIPDDLRAIAQEIAENWGIPPVVRSQVVPCPFFLCTNEAEFWVEIPGTVHLVDNQPIRFRSCLGHKLSIEQHLQSLYHACTVMPQLLEPNPLMFDEETEEIEDNS